MITIDDEMTALDLKDRDFFDNLNDEDRKKFSTFMMIRWGSSVIGDELLETYYLQATNELLNKRFFSINKTNHDKINWLAATTISPTLKKRRHQWIKMKKGEAKNNKVQAFLLKLYPSMKYDDINLLMKVNDVKVWKELAKEMGYTPEQIKRELG
jgi:hypothetical protein